MAEPKNYSVQGITDWLERQEFFAMSVKGSDPIGKELPKNSTTLILDYTAQIKKRIAGRAATDEIDPFTKKLVRSILELRTEIEKMIKR